MIDNRGNTVVWCDFQEVRRKLRVFGNVDGVNCVGDAQFFKKD